MSILFCQAVKIAIFLFFFRIIIRAIQLIILPIVLYKKTCYKTCLMKSNRNVMYVFVIVCNYSNAQNVSTKYALSVLFFYPMNNNALIANG